MQTKPLKLFIIFGLGLMLLSCEKKEVQEFRSEDITPLEQFSTILSRAVSADEALRSFIKKEAGEYFDRDYDVLYGRSKGKVLPDGRTMREALSEYDLDNQLGVIEESLPLLNILVPDWSMIGGFCLEDWDTSSNDIAVACKTDSSRPIYEGGRKIGDLGEGRIPAFAALIVKNNERVKVTARQKTKAGYDYGYEFINEVFDVRKYPETKVKPDYYDRSIGTEDYTNFLPASEVSAEAIAAYNLFKDNRYACHRDNIYYGMTNEIKQGKLNKRISEYIVRFCLGPFNNEFYFDDPNGDFGQDPGSYTRYVPVSDQTLIDRFVYDGNLEIYFHFCLGSKAGEVVQSIKAVSLSFEDAFQLSKVHVEFYHKTWFTSRKWIYTVDKKCFLPKWVSPRNLALPKWDINDDSVVMNINVYEYDPSGTETRSVTVANSFTNNFSIGADGKIGNETLSGSVKIGYGYTDEKKTSVTVSSSITSGSDFLGTAELYYTDPVILEAGDLNGVKGYRIKEINSGKVFMMIMPRYE